MSGHVVGAEGLFFHFGDGLTFQADTKTAAISRVVKPSPKLPKEPSKVEKRAAAYIYISDYHIADSRCMVSMGTKKAQIRIEHNRCSFRSLFPVMV